MDTPSSASGSRGGQPSNTHKDPCPICGRPKTPISLKCGTCEANRQRYLAAKAHASNDSVFLEAVRQRGQSRIAREMGITRQAVHQLVTKAKRRVDFLQQNPLPPLPANLITAEAVPVH